MRTKFFGPKTCDLHSCQPASNFFLREEKIIIKKKKKEEKKKKKIN